MSAKKLRWFLLSIILLLLLAGCGPCDYAGYNNFIVIPDLPADGSIISSLIPDFTWHDDSSCTPDNFLISMHGAGGSYSEYTLIAGTESSYTWHESLNSGNQYNWRIRVNADNGPTGPYSDYLTFYTGPVCSGDTLVPPGSGSPSPGWITHNHLQEFSWSYPGSCLPPFYDYEFATDAAFTNVVDSGTTPDHKMFVEKTFPNCSTIFWRVRANDGSNTGPWSDPYHFHWVRAGTDCYQTHYLSDDFAWITVFLEEDLCDQTGEIAAWTPAPLHDGCMVEGMIIVGDGTQTKNNLKDFVVDLGAGACPSTGLDHKSEGWATKFGVLTPGTYCITISRNQTVDYYGTKNLMDGIWTSPRTNAILAEETVTFGPGLSDESLYFVWDEIDRPFLTLPLEFTYGCKFGPEDFCENYDFAQNGEVIPLIGRDANSDYKLTELNGVACYVSLNDAAINEALSKFEGFDWRAEDLPIFPEPDPCPSPDSKPINGFSCSNYGDKDSCDADVRCFWDRKQSPDACVSR